MKKVPLFEIYWDQSDIDSVRSLIESGKSWADGPIIDQFEDEIANYLGSKHCIVFNSGTSAQTSILMAYGIGPGDQVIVPSFTFISTVNTVLHTGAEPVFVDIENKNLGLDPGKVKKAITNRTKAIIPVHYAGGHSSIIDLKKISSENDILLIEDNAESMGHKISSGYLGTIGDASILSFCQNKIITTGEGGAVLTDSDRIADKLRLIRSHGRSSSEYFTSSKKAEYIYPGYNYRMPSMNAALGLSQLGKIDHLIAMRRKVAKRYMVGLQEIESIEFPQQSQQNHVYQLFPILCNINQRDELMKYLQRQNISCKIYFDPVHESNYLENNTTISNNLLVTEEISRRILNLPIYPGMSESDIDYVVSKVKEFYRKQDK